MWFSYKQTVKIFWKEKADKIFESNWLSKWKVKLTDEEKEYKKYISLSESAHAKILHKRLNEKWIIHNHSPNESWQSWSKNILIMMARKKAEWTSKGYPDLHILLPYKEWLVNLFIELKKAPWVRLGMNWSVFTEEQKKWLIELSKIPFTWTKLSQWSKQAISFIDEMIEILKDKTTMQVLDFWNECKQNSYK